MFQSLIELIGCSLGIALGTIEQLHELTAYDSAIGIGLSRLQSLLVADAEANHRRVLKVHGMHLVEISLFGSIELLLSTSDGSTRHHVDEPIGVLVDETDALP